ncbi:RAD52 motif-containing protein 1 isoform 2-T2 [Clarias gariepinus]|uniref:RAD52 motif-containing protein 1 isoform X2 n=1 Tax=Clarias gariepinus TaxID=13013 RepID=UPI00234CA16A|nr:RAD52 motif-containing protein 1 isoform X2 [Clarias gariepinus]
MELEADIIEFRVPTESNKTIFIWDIQACFSEAYIYESLRSVYSAFGALYLVKVRLSTKNPTFLSGFQSLSHAKCQDLANNYLGYNGWSTRIITLKDISTCTDVGWSLETDSQGELLKYGCIMELTLPQHGVTCRGVGVAEEVVDKEKGPEEKLWKRGKLMKWAKDKAVVAAFEKVLLIVLGNGKIAVECRTDPEEILPDENVEGVIQVNDISWSDFKADAAEGEDLPWNFTVNPV